MEASLILSARAGNAEADKAKILRYAFGKGYRTAEIKDRGFAKVELGFENFQEANRCLEDKWEQGREREILFELPDRAKKCKGIITGWDLNATLDELVSAMVSSVDVVAVERLKRKIYDRETKNVIESVSRVVCITWEGSCVPPEIRIYGRLSGLRVRPFVDNVLQCFNCYKFGYLIKYCKARPVCIACGEGFHGKCQREWNCVNCGGRHKPTSKRCGVYQHNFEIKKIMAIENVPFKEAQEIMQKRVPRNREKINRERENNREERNFSGRIVERGWE